MKLELQSKVNQKEYPFLHNWDQDHRQNYAKYQDEIDKITHGLQRVQRGFFIFGQSTYPNFHQRKLLNLQLYKQKQLLGKVSQSEIDSYKQVNPEIAQDYNNTFNTQLRIPKNHIIFGALTFPVCHYLNIQYTFRIIFVPYSSWGFELDNVDQQFIQDIRIFRLGLLRKKGQSHARITQE